MNKSYTDYLHLFVLVAFAVAQPIYDLLGKNPEFFVAHSAKPALIINMILVLSLGLALVLVLAKLAAHFFGERVRCGVHWLFVFALTVLIAMPLMKQMTASDFLIVGSATLLGLLFTVLYARLPIVRMFMTVLLPVTLIFPVWFVWATPVGRLVMSQSIETHTDIQIGNKVPVVVVVLDEFSITALLDSQERIDSVRFPNFASLAAESFWFPNAVASSETTSLAIPSILTGRNPRPKERLTPTAIDYPNNLFSLLDGEYSINSSEVMTSFVPKDQAAEQSSVTANRYAAMLSDIAVIYLHLVLPPKLSNKLPPLDARWTGFGQELVSQKGAVEKGATNTVVIHNGHTKTIEQHEQFLSQIKVSSRPELYFMHTTMPHIPYHYLASGHIYSKIHELPEGIKGERVGWSEEEPLIVTAYHRYLQQIGYTDIFLGKLKNRLISAGIYDKSLVIITADHGVAFQPLQSRRRITDSNASEILKVPMFVKLPGQKKGRIDERIASSTDLLPTIIDVLEVNVPWRFDGYSVFSDQQPLRKGIEFVGVGYFGADDIVGFSRLEWQTENFGERTPLNQLVPKGPFHELARGNIDDFKIGKITDMSYKLNGIGQFKNVNKESPFLPSLFKGYIEGSHEQKLPIAITVNNIIWATTFTSEWSAQKNYFSVLLPADAFIQGNNTVKVYLIKQSGDDLLLRPIKQERIDATLQQKQSGAKALIFAGGREVLIDTDRNNMDGYLDKLSLEEGLLLFEGWAADLVENKPASNLLIFKGEKLVWQGVPTYNRPGVGKALNRPALTHSGYRMTVPLTVFGSLSGDVSVIAVSEEKRAFRIRIKNVQKELIRTVLAK